ncbi:MAG: FtsW/RodA/SpoVE family cell cycle protein, partial [Treponema sp.]|nr:FtsW/RodA/SpoVE family cell cycle protein [Treponema sp.]
MEDYVFRSERIQGEYKKSDSVFVACTIILLGLGIFTLFICSQNYGLKMFSDPYYFLKRQLASVALGLLGFLIFASLKIQIIRKMIPLIIVATFVLCVMTFIPGISIERNGARRWLRLPLAFTLQPSEFVKFAIVLFLANFFEKQERLSNKDEKTVLPAVIVLSIFSVMVLFQKDFSTSLFIFGIGLVLFFATSAKLLWFFPSLVLIIPAIVFMIFQEPYRIDRIIAFMKPTEGAVTYNYQSIAAKRAISAGGFWGEGIGSALQWINRIPEVQADYIFAGWTEAMGFLGVVLYFVLLLIFAWRGYRASLRCMNKFASYAAFGCISVIIFQSILNCAVVCGAL